jgi:hypothetical protein
MSPVADTTTMGTSTILASTTDGTDAKGSSAKLMDYKSYGWIGQLHFLKFLLLIK